MTMFDVRAIVARYDGLCGNCREPYSKGDHIVNNGDNGYVPVDCGCLEDMSEPTGGDEVGYRERRRKLADFMPRGKTARDACPKCFIIHATGQKECEW